MNQQSNGLSVRERADLAATRRVVVKVGTHTLASRTGRPNAARLRALVGQIAAMRKRGQEVVLVSSGAVGMGLDALRRKRKPGTLAELQMAAAVGQSRLMHVYQELFAKHRLLVGQVLLTHDDLHHRARHLNARATFRSLLQNGVIPIVNENDTVSVDEIRFGDNDQLAAHIALLVDADALVLLTTVNGLQNRNGTRAKRIKLIERLDEEVLGLGKKAQAGLSTGGMQTKLLAAQLAHRNGVAVVIADGRKADSLIAVSQGEDRGTLILPSHSSPRGARKRWLAFSRRASGEIEVDAGAVEAIQRRNSSLLPVGVVAVRGSFAAGELVKLCDPAGETFAKGLSNYHSAQVEALRGCRSSEIERRIGARQFDEIVHRDNLVVL